MSLYDWLALPFGAQWRLGLWLPLAGYAAWLLLVRVWGVRSPRVRFWSLLAVVLLVPLVYAPPLLAVLPHVMGWESAVIPDEDLARLVSRPESAPTPVGAWAVVFHWPLLFIGVGVHCALFVGFAEYLWAALRIALLPKRREGKVWVIDVPNLSAFTFGIVSPKVYVTREVWEGPHREAVVAHELVHARRRDPLLLFVARGIRRSTLYLPFSGRMFDELCREAERDCDVVGVQTAGRKRYAQALLDFAEADAPRPAAAMNFGAAKHTLLRTRGWLLPTWIVVMALWFGTANPQTPDLSLMPGWFGLPLSPAPILLTLVAFTLLSQLHATTSPDREQLSRRVRTLLATNHHKERLAAFWFSFAIVYLIILSIP